MQERQFTLADLLLATSHVLSRLFLVWGVIAIVKAIAYFALGLSGAHAIVFSLLFGALFFSAPIAVSSLRGRRRTRLMSSSGRTTLSFCFAWGAVVVALFIGFLQLTQDMLATPMNYLLAMLAGGTFCLLTAAIPSGK